MALNNLLNTFSALTYNNTIILVVVSALTIALVVDTSIIKISDLSSEYQQSSSSWKIVTFSVISAVYAIAQYLILKFVKTKNKQIWSKGHMLELKGSRQGCHNSPVCNDSISCRSNFADGCAVLLQC